MTRTRTTVWGTLALLLASPFAPAAEPLVLSIEGLPELDRRPPVVTALALSPDGTRVAAAGDDHRVCVWDAASGRVLHTFTAHEDWVRSARFAGADGRLATVGADHTLHVWDLTSEKPRSVARRLANGPLYAVAWRPDGNELATVGFGDSLRRHDLAAPDSAPDARPCPCEDTRGLAYSPDGKWLAAAGRDGVIRLWDLRASGPPRDLPSDGRRVRALAFSTDGRTLAAGGDGPAVRLWRFEAGAVGDAPDELLVRPGKVHALAFVDEVTLAVGGTTNRVVLWDTDTRQTERELAGHTGTIAALAVSADGGRIASGSFDTTVRVWDLAPEGLPAGVAAKGPPTRR